MNIFISSSYSRAATISANLRSVQHLFEGGYYSKCGVYLRKYSVLNYTVLIGVCTIAVIMIFTSDLKKCMESWVASFTLGQRIFTHLKEINKRRIDTKEDLRLWEGGGGGGEERRGGGRKNRRGGGTGE